MKMYEDVIQYIATLKSAKLYIKALWQSLMVGFRSEHLSSLPTPHNLHSLPRSARKDGRPIGTSSRSQSLEPLFLLEVLKSIAHTRGCTAKLILGSIHTSWHNLLPVSQRWHQWLKCNRPRIAKSPKGPTCTSQVAACAFSPSSAGMQSLQTWLQAPEVVRTSRNLKCGSKTALRATGTKLCNRFLLFLPQLWEVPWTCSGRSRLDSSCGMREYIPKMDPVPTGTSWHMSTHNSWDMRSRCTPERTAGRPMEPIGTNQAVQRTVVSTTRETGTSSCQKSPQNW